MNLLELPELVLNNIFLLLTPESLHTCRLVSKEFNQKILEVIWLSKSNWKILKHRLENNWMTRKYKITFEFFRKCLIYKHTIIFIMNNEINILIFHLS